MDQDSFVDKLAVRLTVIALFFLALLLNGCTSPTQMPPSKAGVTEELLSEEYLALQGRWVVMRNEIKKTTTPDMHGRLFIFQGRAFRLDTDRGSEGFVIGGKTNPKSIDFSDGRSPVIRGIYTIDGNRMVICTGAPGAPRPRAFATSLFSGTVLTELQKEK